MDELRKQELRIEGHAGNPIWSMTEANGEIGLRLDCGDAGVVWMTPEQARETIEALKAELAEPQGEPEGELVERAISSGEITWHSNSQRVIGMTAHFWRTSIEVFHCGVALWKPKFTSLVIETPERPEHEELRTIVAGLPEVIAAVRAADAK
jgi:hypothetical protein